MDKSIGNAPAKKCGNISAEQRKELIEFLDKHPELRSGKFTSEFTFKKAQLLWIEATEMLNCLPGAKKDWKQWRRTWQDMKSVVKKKKSVIRNYENATGGGPAINIKLSADEQKVLDILGPIATEGDLEIQESSCSFSLDDCSYTVVEETSQHVVEDMAVIEFDYAMKETREETKKKDASNETSCEDKTRDEDTSKSVLFSGQPSTKSNGGMKTKKPVRVRRLEHSLKANDKLIDLTVKKINLKEKSLTLYERDVAAKESIAISLHKLCHIFTIQNQ